MVATTHLSTIVGAPGQEMMNVREVDCDKSETHSNGYDMMIPIQESMKGDFEQLRPFPDFCNLMDLIEGEHMADSKPPMQRDVTDVPIEEIRPCCAYWGIENVIPSQAICSTFCGCPSCIGCVGQCTLICCLCKFVNCKLLDCSDEDSRCCALQQCNWFLSLPNKVLESQCQVCCVDYRAAGPCCTKKVPCFCNILGFTLCADWKCKTGCCKKAGELVPRLMERVGKSPVSSPTAEPTAPPPPQVVQVTVNVAK